MMKFENTLQYVTFADRSQVENMTPSYDTLLFPSNILVGGEKALTALIRSLVEEHDVEFYIDPTSTEFNRGVNFRDSDGSLKSWHSKLVGKLGEPFDSLLQGKRNLAYHDLESDKREEAVKSICDFQQNFVADAVEENVGKYEVVDTEMLRPRAVIPLYTKIRNFDDFRLNQEFIELADDYCDLPTKPCLHLTKAYISDTTRRRVIAEAISDLSLSEIFIWIDDLGKSASSVDEYVDTLDLVSKFSDEGVDPHFMYGDYFSYLLFFFGLRGTSYGTYYRESSQEKLERSGGGGSLQRYYYEPIKEYLNIPDAISLAEATNEDVPSHGPLQDWGELYKYGDDHDFLKNHSIRAKANHKEEILTEELSVLTESLEDNYELYNQLLLRQESTKDAEHLLKWVQAISTFQEEYPELAGRVTAEALELRTG